jgi:hypothetical protein
MSAFVIPGLSMARPLSFPLQRNVAGGDPARGTPCASSSLTAALVVGSRCTYRELPSAPDLCAGDRLRSTTEHPASRSSLPIAHWARGLRPQPAPPMSASSASISEFSARAGETRGMVARRDVVRAAANCGRDTRVPVARAVEVRATEARGDEARGGDVARVNADALDARSDFIKAAAAPASSATRSSSPSTLAWSAARPSQTAAC